MEYILIFFLIVIVGAFGYLLFKSIKWIVSNRIRKFSALTIVSILVLFVAVNKLFFEKMEFVQSKVYPNLFLIKHPIKDRDSINELIKIKVIENLKNRNLEENRIPKINFKSDIETIKDNDKTIHFYQYTTAWGFNNGTKHFIENEEDAGGFSSEVLNNYYEYQMAFFKLEYCKKDSSRYFGNLSFFKDGDLVETDTIIDLCKKE